MTLYVAGDRGQPVPYVLTVEDLADTGHLSWMNPRIQFDHRHGQGLCLRTLEYVHVLGWDHYLPASHNESAEVSAALRDAGFACCDVTPTMARGVPVYGNDTVAVWRGDIGTKPWWHAKAFDRVGSGPTPLDAASSLRRTLVSMRDRIAASLA